MRGDLLLDRLSQLGVNLDTLEEYIKLVERLASEKHMGAEDLIDSALTTARGDKNPQLPDKIWIKGIMGTNQRESDWIIRRVMKNIMIRRQA